MLQCKVEELVGMFYVLLYLGWASLFLMEVQNPSVRMVTERARCQSMLDTVLCIQYVSTVAYYFLAFKGLSGNNLAWLSTFCGCCCLYIIGCLNSALEISAKICRTSYWL